MISKETASSITNQTKFVQHHADELYKVVEAGDKGKAMWHAHEVAKGLNTISWIIREALKAND